MFVFLVHFIPVLSARFVFPAWIFVLVSFGVAFVTSRPIINMGFFHRHINRIFSALRAYFFMSITFVHQRSSWHVQASAVKTLGMPRRCLWHSSEVCQRRPGHPLIVRCRNLFLSQPLCFFSCLVFPSPLPFPLFATIILSLLCGCKNLIQPHSFFLTSAIHMV